MTKHKTGPGPVFVVFEKRKQKAFSEKFVLEKIQFGGVEKNRTVL